MAEEPDWAALTSDIWRHVLLQARRCKPGADRGLPAFVGVD